MHISLKAECRVSSAKKNRSSHDINTVSNFNSRPGLVESEYNSALATHKQIHLKINEKVISSQSQSQSVYTLF